jgi:glycerol-3-phosphate acyltransferase PlsX
MGGDNAPDAILRGALDAVELLGSEHQLVLIGDEEIIREGMAEAGLSGDARIIVEATTEVIEMDDSPVSALRCKPDSSIVRMSKLGGHRHSGANYCDVVISAGNTGACVAAAQMEMRRLPGVVRPGIAVTIPTFSGPVVLCDVGANPEPKPRHLHHYAQMATIYATRVIGVENPKIALMSIGEEEAKGNALVKEAAKLIREDKTLNYVGFCEGRDLFAGKADVVVTEGFTGNVILKLSEALAAGIFATITREILEEDPELALRFEPVVKSIYKKHDYHEYGGAPLLGANGICMICHGSSEARTITCAIRAAIRHAEHDVNNAIVAAIAHTPKESAV